MIHVRPDGEGPEAKRLKTAASERDIPIAQPLLALGLREFVVSRAHAVGTRRVFPDIPFGQRGRKSDGLTKWWSRYLRKHELWKPGRATHVFRHSFTRALRKVGTPEEVMSTLLGHAPTTITGQYGGERRPMSERVSAVAALDYGFDVYALIECQEAMTPSG